MKRHIDPRRRLLAWSLALIVALWAITVALRMPWFGILSHQSHQWLSASTLKFAENWRAEGAFALGFRLLENPRSIEFPTLASREPYFSYPPGAVVPVWLWGLAKGSALEPGDVMIVNLLVQLLVAVLVFALALTVLRGRQQSPPVPIALLALMPAVLELTLAAPVYYHLAAFWADQAILPLFLGVVLLEAHRPWRDSPTGKDAAMALLLFAACLTDWLSLSLIAVLAVVRLRRGERAGSVAVMLGLPAALAFGLFAVQVLSLEGQAALVDKLMERAALGGSDRLPYLLTFVSHDVTWPAAVAWAGLLVLAVRSWWRREAGGETLVLLAVPCVLHWLALPQHAQFHGFTVLKAIPFLGIAAMRYLPASRAAARIAAAATLVLGIHGVVKGLGWFSDRPLPNHDTLQWLRAEARYDDVVLSPCFAVPALPPQELATARKRVHRIDSAVVFDRLVAGFAARNVGRWVIVREGCAEDGPPLLIKPAGGEVPREAILRQLRIEARL